MARTPLRHRAVAAATHQEGRARRLLRRAVAVGGAAIGVLLLPLRLLRRAFRSRSAKAKRDKAAAMARRMWRDDAQPPRGEPLLGRAVARAGAAFRPAGHALAVALGLLRRALRLGGDLLGRVPKLVRHLLRLLLPPPPPPPTPPTPPKPPTPPTPPQHRRPWIDRLRPVHSAYPPSPPSPPPQRPKFTVDGEPVPEGVVGLYREYGQLASTCPAKWTVCHFCVFEMQRSEKFMVPTSDMFLHCRDYHDDEGDHGNRCNEGGCSARVRAGRDAILHRHFCHNLVSDWWRK